MPHKTTTKKYTWSSILLNVCAHIDIDTYTTGFHFACTQLNCFNRILSLRIDAYITRTYHLQSLAFAMSKNSDSSPLKQNPFRLASISAISRNRVFQHFAFITQFSWSKLNFCSYPSTYGHTRASYTHTHHIYGASLNSLFSRLALNFRLNRTASETWRDYYLKWPTNNTHLNCVTTSHTMNSIKICRARIHGRWPWPWPWPVRL